MLRHNSLIALVALTAVAVCMGGCRDGSGRSPAVPDISRGESLSAAQNNLPNHEINHYLWGFYLVRIDPGKPESEIIPIRETAHHFNILKFLEQTPCTDCFKIEKISPGPSGTFDIDISIKHPFSTPLLTGFDVRGIAMFNGSRIFPASGLSMSDSSMGDGELLNADGYTPLSNPETADHGPLQGYMKGKLATLTPPDATLNGYRRFISDDPSNIRNAFFAGDKITVTYNVKLPSPMVFGYAIDSNWAQPLKKPVEDPMTDFGPDANCPEPWKLESSVTEINGGLKPDGGEVLMTVSVYDWQGKDSHSAPVIECPELFNGIKDMAFKSDGDGYTDYEITITNELMADTGQYTCLVKVEDKDNAGSPDWLDLSAYSKVILTVNSISLEDITPPWLNFSPVDICIDGNYAYVAAGVNGLHIFDITDPADPVWVNRVETENTCESVDTENGYAYVADNGFEVHGVLIIDVDPPEAAHIVKKVEFPGTLAGVEVTDGYVYMTNNAGWDVYFSIVDIDPPESAYILHSFEFPGFAGGIEISDGYAYVDHGYNMGTGLSIVDIDPPESAHTVNTISTGGDIPRDIAVSNGYAYVASDIGGLWIVDVDPPGSAAMVSILDTPGVAKDIAVSNGYAYVADGYSGLHVIEVVNPETPVAIGAVDTPGDAIGVALSGDTAFVADRLAGLFAADIGSAGAPTILNRIDTPGLADEVAVSDGYAYVSNGGYGLQIIDIDPPESADIINSIDGLAEQPAEIKGIDVSGGYAYINRWNGLVIIDVDPPESAYIVNTVDTELSPDGISISGGYAFTLKDSPDNVLKIIDIDPPELSFVTNTVDLPGVPDTLVTSGGYAYVAGYDDVWIVDVDPPETAYIPGSVNSGVDTRDMAVSDGYLYSGNFYSGVEISDIDPVESAYLVKTVYTPGRAFGVAVAGDHVFVADRWEGLHVLNVNQPEDAYIAASLDTPGDAMDVAVYGDCAYVADYNAGLRIVDLY